LTGETVKTLDGSVSRLEQLSISADGSLIGAACEFGRLQIWDYRTGAIMFSLPGRQWPEKDWLNVLVLAFSPSSNRFAFTLHDRICIGHILKS
jgi:WD40 repeat protein